MHRSEKNRIFPPFMIITSWNTYNGSFNKTMVLFVETGVFALNPKTQYIGWKKLGFSRPKMDRGALH